MIRNLNCEILARTWPNSLPPQNMTTNLTGAKDVDIFQFLLTIGYCTVPSHAAKHSINALWAWVRYFGALSGGDDFELNHDFSELDPHQKTILSDDFGMGMSLHLLTDALNLVSFCDGKYFIDRLATRLGCTVTASAAKKGPNKSPDFVAQDSSGRFHVIECKGTQSGRNYALKQLRDAFPQKRSVRIAQSLKGESLATGFVISQQAKDWASNFIVADPEPESPLIEILEKQGSLAIEAIARGKIARSMTLAGATNLSRVIAAPFGDDPRNMRDSFWTSDSGARADRLREESLNDLKRLTRFGDGFLGREATIELPFAVDVGTRSYNKVFVRSSVDADVIGSWTERMGSGGYRDADDTLSDQEGNAASGKMETWSDEAGGYLKDGGLFASEVQLISG